MAGYRAIVNADPNTQNDPPPPTYERNPVRLAWNISSSRDRYNNEIKYIYHNFGSCIPGAPIEFLPVLIAYNFVKGTSDRSVEFNWGTSDRTDLRSSFVGGVAQQNTRLLRSITMKAPAPSTSSALRSYRVEYQDVSGAHAQLQAVTECDGQGVCKAPTTFTWTTIEPTFKRVPVSLGNAPHSARSLVPADVNGDGRDDLIFPGTTGNQWVFCSSET